MIELKIERQKPIRHIDNFLTTWRGPVKLLETSGHFNFAKSRKQFINFYFWKHERWKFQKYEFYRIWKKSFLLLWLLSIINLLFEVYSLDIKCYGNSRLWSCFCFVLLQSFLAFSVSSALVKPVPLSATVPAFAFCSFWKIENIYFIFSTISKVVWTVKS